MIERDEKMLRPKFHVTGGTGWINDPNGLVLFKGQYHAFYQYYPHDVHWGPMHWGHVASSDLLNWERLPIALCPGEEFDKNGCFSGSAIVWKDKLWVIYTGFIENEGGETIRQIQCLASSEDGIVFKKHGVVIGEDNLPSDYCPWDFRDPKIWRYNDEFWCIVATRRKGGRGRILLYRSSDMFKWQFVNDLFGEDSLGAMIECPDYVQDKGLLLCGEQFQPNEGKTHLNIHTTRWYTGFINYQTGRFEAKKRGIIDYGFDFYAPQTFAYDGAMMGWLQMWDRNIPTEKYGFAGALTVARKLTVVDDEMRQEPIIKGKVVKEQTVKNEMTDNVKIGVLKIKAENLTEFSLKIRRKGDNYALLKLNGDEWVFDRSRAGEQINGQEKDEDSLSGIRRMPYNKKKITSLTIVLDEFSVEIFEDGKALSSTVYPSVDADGLELKVKADSCSYVREEI